MQLAETVSAINRYLNDSLYVRRQNRNLGGAWHVMNIVCCFCFLLFFFFNLQPQNIPFSWFRYESNNCKYVFTFSKDFVAAAYTNKYPFFSRLPVHVKLKVVWLTFHFFVYNTCALVITIDPACAHTSTIELSPLHAYMFSFHFNE
jgi:hypothetical protein